MDNQWPRNTRRLRAIEAASRQPAEYRTHVPRNTNNQHEFTKWSNQESMKKILPVTLLAFSFTLALHSSAQSNKKAPPPKPAPAAPALNYQAAIDKAYERNKDLKEGKESCSSGTFNNNNIVNININFDNYH